MSAPVFTKGTFVIADQEEDEELAAYLERVFFQFEQYLEERVPTMSQGHYQEVTAEAAGGSDLLINPQHRITNAVVRAEAGTGAFVYDLKLTENRTEDNKTGDRAIIYLSAPASTNPTIRILNQDSVVIATKTFDGTGNDSSTVTVTKIDDIWQI